ncbi:hypothetical protein BGP75_25685 [Motiliproteus sp. MSK22-1]|nr:hypothetical protein BGP75_25685 [Motiliproteus sp. MSK22-1]
MGKVYGAPYNGFDVTGSLIPVEKIMQGGPPRDGIPAIDSPVFVSIDSANHLAADSLLLGLEVNGVSKAYPLSILNWHEVVNDRFNETAVVVTFCPLCGTGVAYRAENKGRDLSFGVSGLLYNSDVLLYDRQTESLWSQLKNQSVTGPMKGQRLEMLPALLTTWDAWKKIHPDTLVLSTDTGYRRDYSRDPYFGYDNSPRLFFPVEFLSRAYHPKERVLGLEYKGQFKAYPFAELSKMGEQGVLKDNVAGEWLTVEYDASRRSGRVYDSKGSEIAVVNAFWFAWFTFNPETDVYTSP